MAKNLDIEFKGAIFDARKVEKIIGQETSKVLDKAALDGESAVKVQLYKPDHGVVTGFLRESVAGTRVNALTTIIDAGEVLQGSQVVYANRIEGIFSMFRNALQVLKGQNLKQVLARRIAKRLNG